MIEKDLNFEELRELESSFEHNKLVHI